MGAGGTLTGDDATGGAHADMPFCLPGPRKIEDLPLIFRAVNQDLVIGLVLVGMGVLAFVLPYRFNPFRLKGLIEPLVPERARAVVPKVIGGLMLVIGAIVSIGALTAS